MERGRIYNVSTTQSYLMNHDEEEIDAMFGI